MFSKLNDDILCNILLCNKSINSLNNNLHISKHIYKLIINDYNKLYKNTFILLIRRWQKFANESKLVKSIKYILCYNRMIHIDIYNNLNTNSIKEFNKSLHDMNYIFNWDTIISNSYKFSSLKFSRKEYILLKQIYKIKIDLHI